MYNEYETSPNFVDQDLDNRTYEQIYHEFENCKRKQKQNLEKQFNQFVQDINKQLANPFYRNLDIAVNIQVWDKNNQVIGDLDKTVKTNPKNKKNKIKIQFFLREDGSVSVNHQFSEDYLKEFEKYWEKEAKARGMKVDVSGMRKDIIKYLNSQEAEASFGKKFLREIRTWYDASVAGYIEGIQATQKVTTHIWEEGTINQSTWYSKNNEHTQWPSYMQFNPVVGGATDGVVDEIVGIPMACKSVYELATEDEKRKALGQIFTSEGFMQMLEGMKKEAIDVANDQEKLEHFTGQTTISVASMLIPGGAITKAGKLDEYVEVAEQAVKKADEIPDSSLIKNLDYIKKTNRNVSNELEIKQFTEIAGNDVLLDIGKDLKKIYKKGEDAIVLKKARNLPGISKGIGNEIKGKWLKGKFGNAGLFPKSIADKLRGKEFSSFDDFRKQFWKAVADDPDLSSQFRKQNISRMKDGKAPRVSSTQNVGGQKSYVLHHKTPINQGGGVYDMDNLYIVTPRFHKEILAPEYHYGYGY